MALYDSATGDYSYGSFALDTTSALADQGSVFDSIGNVITKGIPLTALSVANSFANTGIEVANIFGANLDHVTADGELQSLGWDDYKNYYDAHQQGIEAAGLIAGSLIPGLAAVKAVKLMQAGRLGEIAARATNLFMPATQGIIDDTLATIKAGDAALYPALNANKYQAIALGFRDQAVQSLAFEAATAATMKGSPLLDDQSYTDMATNAFYGMLLGGGIGGTMEGIATRGVINKAYIAADNATKAQEMVKYLGMSSNAMYDGTSIAGDRVVSILDSLDKIPSGGGLLGAKKAQMTTDNAILNAKKALQSLVSPGDEDLSNALFDTLYQAKVTGGMDKDDIYNTLSRLAAIKRIGDPPSIPSTDFFYVNKFAPNNQASSLSDLLTNAPVQSADLSRRYQLSPYAGPLKIARFDQQFEGPNGVVPLYNTQKEAFEAGNDLWIGPKLQIAVNPDSENIIGQVPRPGENRVLSVKEEQLFRKTGQLPPGSAPLTGAPLVMDLTSGAVTTKATPTIGDMGNIKLTNAGLTYGQRGLSIQNMNTPLTAETSNIDASARYVWAAQRGIRNGDTIEDTDIPMLEQLYREGSRSGNWDTYIQQLNKRGVSLASGDDLPTTANEALSKIRGAKDDLIHDLIQNNPNMSADEVANRANVPEKYIENAFRADKPGDFMIDPEQLAKVNHVQLEYNIGNVNTQDGNILRGLLDTQYRINLIQDVARTATAKFFGKDWEQFIAPKYTSADANIGGVGPGFVTFSNSNYGTLGQAMERIGRFTTNLITKRQSDIARIFTPAANDIRNDPQAAAELGMFIAVRRRTGEAYTFLPETLAQKYLPDVQNPKNVAVLTKSLVKDKNGNVIDWNQDYRPDGFFPGLAKKSIVDDTTLAAKGLRTYYELGDKVANFEMTQMQLNDARIMARNDWYAAQGLNKDIPTGNLYAPPIDTGKYPHVALVKALPGKAFSDDGVSVITAETAKDLEQKIASLSDDFSVYTKDMIKKYHEVQGDYEYNRNFNMSQVNNELRRRGVLSDVFPDTRAETILKDYTDFNSRQEIRLIRDHVELGNSQLFAELQAMGERFTAPETSQARWWSSLLSKQADNPYDDYIRTALAVKDQSYTLWNNAQEKAEAFASTAYRTARQYFTAAGKGLVSYEDASNMAEKMGLGNPYRYATDALSAYYDVANKLPPTNILSRFVGTANAVQSATAIRLDTFQSLINIVSSPILTLAEANSAKQLISTTFPDGSGRQIPSIGKLIASSIKNWWDPAVRNQWLPIYKDMGIVRESSSEYFKSIEAMTLPYGSWSENAIHQKIKDMVDLGSKITGSQSTENFVRYVAADMARQIFSAAGVQGTDLIDNIGTFVNRVHGNYIASQRPIAFQGPIGQAMSLFQTYQFNMLQQLFRYVENGEGKTLALLAGLQGTIFGVQGLPGFSLINQHIVGTAAGNPAHKDLYGTITSFAGKDLADYLLYGVASNWTQAGLYGRGDINPRQISVLPLNPLEFPAISGGINFLSNLFNMSDKIAKGGAVTSVLLNGMEHNGLSRPLAGLGQLMQGYVTTGDGGLVATTRNNFSDNAMGWNDIFNWANFGRLLGARPLDEAVAMDSLYQKTLYQAKDNSRIEALGAAAKPYLAGDQTMDPTLVQNFATKYASMGGWMPRFGQEIQKWSQEANVSKANEIYRQLELPINQQMMLRMGGRTLPDYRMFPGDRSNAPAIGTPNTQAATTSVPASQ